MKKRTAEALGCAVILAIAPVFFFAFAFVQAFVGRQLWQWFIEPTFRVPAPSFAMFYGLVLFVAVIAPEPARPKEKEEQEWWAPLIKYPLILLIGYITHWLVIR
jgi:hypothetical protein